MYPYNRNTQLYTTTLEMKETAGKQTLAKDRRLIEVLALAAQEIADMSNRYARMVAEEEMAASKDVTKAMYLDELKHQKQLQEAQYIITGNKEPHTYTGKEPDKKGGELVEETLLMEMDNGDFYRTLTLMMPTQELRDIFYEISSDKQSHATALSYLFAKYFS